MSVCVFGGLHHRKLALHPAVECDPLALDQMLLWAEYHEASVLCTALPCTDHLTACRREEDRKTG